MVYEFPVKEGETLIVFGIQYPLDFMNGMKLHFPEGAFSDIIKIVFTLPIFANINDNDRNVTFGKDIISAVSFDVYVNDELVSPYYFDKPIEVSIPYDREVLQALGIEPIDLGMFFVESSGELSYNGISNIVVDEDASLLTAYVAHFSDIAVAPKSVGPSVFEGLPNLLGDFDNNWRLDFADYTQFVVNWNADNISGDIAGPKSDPNMNMYPPWSQENYPFDPDGVINFEDQIVFAMMYDWFQSLSFEGTAKPITSVAKQTPSLLETGLGWNKKDYEVGDTIIISLNPGEVNNFLGAEIILNYDREILRVNNVFTKAVLNIYDYNSPVYYSTSQGELTASTVVLGNLKKGITISGVNLFDIEFEVINEGDFNIYLSSIDIRDFNNNPIMTEIENESIVGKILTPQEDTPYAFGLSQNFPNPFNIQTTIIYTLDNAGEVDIKIYNSLGQEIKTLVIDTREAGQYSVVWNGTDDGGNVVSTGIYFIRLIQGKSVDSMRILLVK